jgi:catechol 2,3-dioxygenase-like lactoylglutathione lyase family enzyme
LATHDMEATLEFYEQVLGCRTRVCEMIHPETGGAIRHAFLDIGNGEFFAFMECNDVKGVAEDFDAGINRGLGIGGGMFHFSFKVADAVELEKKRLELAEKGVTVTDVVDHGWCKSIYFRDPNHLQLEFCCLTVELGEDQIRDRRSEAWTRWSRR